MPLKRKKAPVPGDRRVTGAGFKTMARPRETSGQVELYSLCSSIARSTSAASTFKCSASRANNSFFAGSVAKSRISAFRGIRAKLLQMDEAYLACEPVPELERIYLLSPYHEKTPVNCPARR